LDLKQRAYSEWLVVRSQQGDEVAFRRLLSYWEQRLLRYAVRRLEDPEAARDVTQECLLSASRGIGKLGDPAAFPKWLFRIQERRCADFLKRKIREREIVKSVSVQTEESKTDDLENKLSVEQLISSFDSEIQLILRLYYLEGFSVSEIATIIEKPAGTIKSRLFYARKSLIEKVNPK